MWKKLKTILSSLFGNKKQLPAEPIESPVVEQLPVVVEEVPVEPMIKQLKKKRQKKNS
jgi:hypothetical protein